LASGEISDELWKFNFISKEWKLMANAPFNCFFHSFWSFNNKHYFFGGFNGIQNLNSLHSYDLKTNKFCVEQQFGDIPSIR
jgi:hypothetical protein